MNRAKCVLRITDRFEQSGGTVEAPANTTCQARKQLPNQLVVTEHSPVAVSAGLFHRGQTEHVAQQSRNQRLHFAPVDDGVDHAMLEQKLGTLEAFRQFLLDGLLDDARTGEANQRTRLSDV